MFITSSLQRKQVNRFLWADLIRGVSVLLVILVHVSAVPMVHAPIDSSDWMASNVLNEFARVCVPLFFMVSGALLLPTQESLRDFYWKRFRKVAIPFLFWSFLYLYAGNHFTGESLISTLKIYGREVSTRPAEYHLWFIYDLFLLYLLVPIFRVFVQNAGDKLLWYFIAVWFVFGPIQSQVERLTGLSLKADLGFFTGFLGYFVLGYILNRVALTRRLVWSATAVYLASGLFTIWAVYATSLDLGKLDTYYQTMTGWNIAINSISAYILLKAAGDAIASRSWPRLENWVRNLASASFGIYLIHIFVLRYLGHPSIPFYSGLRKALSRYALDPTMSPVALTNPFIAIAVFLISWAIVALIRKIPYLRSVT